MSKNDLHKQLIELLKELHLPMFREYSVYTAGISL